MGEMQAFGDGAPRLRRGRRAAGWLAFCGLVYCCGAPGYSQTRQRVPHDVSPFGVRVVGTTNTQAILTYSAPDNNACTVKVSQQASLTPLVHDVDPALFPGAYQDTRP